MASNKGITFAPQRGSGYKNYDYGKRFIIDQNTAVKNRFIYFAKFSSEYKPDSFSIDNNVMLSLKLILEKARDVQEAREKIFVRGLNSSLKDTQKNFDLSLFDKRTSDDTFKIYQQFLQDNLTVAGLRDTIFEALTKNNNALFLYAVRQTLNKLVSSQSYSKILSEDEEKFTSSFRETLWKEIVVQLKQSDLKIDFNTLEVDESLKEALSGFGIIAERSKSKVVKFLKNAEKKDPDALFSELRFEGLHSNLIGMADEIGNYLSIKLKSEMEKGNSKVNFSPDYQGSKNKKTDISMTIDFPELPKTLQKHKISISAKASTITKDGFRTQAKFADKASLKTRYQEIENFFPKKNSISKEDLNKVFYHINNSLANNLSVQSDNILNILATASLNFMFEGMVEELKTKNKKAESLNFFLVGGKIIPSSAIFNLMLTVVQDIGLNPKGIARVSFQKTSTTAGEYYYNSNNYDKLTSIYAENATQTGDMTRSLSRPYSRMRDWLEKEAKLGFYLNTARIFNMLNLNP